MRALGLMILAWIGMGAAPQAPRAAASIKGVVVQLGTLQPVSKAVVRLAKDNTSEPLAATTGADGTFEFRNVPAGAYDLMAARSGFLDTAYGQRGPSGSGRKLTVEAGTDIDNIRLLITATGAISGRVFDDTGEPLANVTVQALKYSYVDGQRILNQVKIDQTNDLGEFRLFWLPPGQYYVSAQPPGSQPDMVLAVHRIATGGRTVSFDLNGRLIDPASSSLGGRKTGEAYVPVYYPGITDPQNASRVEVRPGADLRGLDFSLARVTTRTVRGTVVNAATGLPADVANVQLVPRGDIGGTFRGSLDRGKFEISGVLPGAYFLVATARFGPREDIKTMGGRTAVDVGYADLDNINVTLFPAMDIAGTVTVEGRLEGLPADAHPTLFLQGRRDWNLPSLAQAYASFSTPARFAFNNVVEGDYQLWWDNLPQGTYVKSARFGPIDALNMGIHVDSRTVDTMQIVLGTDAGALEGVVRDNSGTVVPGAYVALVPDAGHRQRADLYQGASTDEAGRFRLQGIPPGDYSLFAWEDIEQNLWQDPEFIRKHEPSGRPVRITENGRGIVEIVSIPFAF